MEITTSNGGTATPPVLYKGAAFFAGLVFEGEGKAVSISYAIYGYISILTNHPRMLLISISICVTATIWIIRVV